jgi:hypothetical protein
MLQAKNACCFISNFPHMTRRLKADTRDNIPSQSVLMTTVFHDVTQSGLVDKYGPFGMSLMPPACGQKTEEIFTSLPVS